MVKYLFAQISLPFGFGALILTDTHVLHLLPLPSQFALVPSVAAVLFGFFAPKIYLRNAADKRAKQLQLALPDGLDSDGHLCRSRAEPRRHLGSRIARARQYLAGACRRVRHHGGRTDLSAGPPHGVRQSQRRTDSDGIRGVVNTLQQTAKYGTPLAQSLRVLAAEMRTARMTRAEEKAARLPALLTIPMMIFILPTLFIVLLGPAAINVMDTFKH